MPDQKTKTALDILEAEVNLAVARCKRIGIQRKILDEQDDHLRTGIVGISTATETEEERRHLHLARVAEQAAQTALEARQTGCNEVTGLDALCSQHRLTEVERAVLVLAFIPAASKEMAGCLDHISVHGYGSDVLVVESVANYFEMGFADRLVVVDYFRADAPLVQHGLVNLDVGRSGDPQDWRDAVVRLTSKAFEAIVGATQ